jgi:hypothetical protein
MAGNMRSAKRSDGNRLTILTEFFVIFLKFSGQIPEYLSYDTTLHFAHFPIHYSSPIIRRYRPIV